MDGWAMNGQHDGKGWKGVGTGLDWTGLGGGISAWDIGLFVIKIVWDRDFGMGGT
jgi:hypothetical protein